MKRVDAVASRTQSRPSPEPLEQGVSSPDIARRVIVERLRPEIDAGRFPIKRSVGETVRVTADVFADGHDRIAGVLQHRRASASGPEPRWIEVPLTALGNDEWAASFQVGELGIHEYTVEAWIDHFQSWLHELAAKAGAGLDVGSELLEGANLVAEAAARLAPPGADDSGASDADGDWLRGVAGILRSSDPQERRVAVASDARLAALMAARADRRAATRYPHTLRVLVDPVRARFSTWYELFPRSCTTDASRSGTLRDAEQRLPVLADMGFDVIYLPPIHPIGITKRKGRNNALVAGAGDPGSPWAIGGAAGGHTSVHPDLGTIDDFDRFVGVAGRLGMHVALDIAFQASPDHPWVREHPEWFRHRPDGSIKYAENPPKKYQDIYPFDFSGDAAPALWNALHDVFAFWMSHGVRTFRVDNPHTKAFPFWEWCFARLVATDPDVMFLAEAFTRPKVMRSLAKRGFNQSYTYFTWRNGAAELRDYVIELTSTQVKEYLRPNFFANTPDILTDYLQQGGRPAFEIRLVLAATLSASYGIYSGFELCENVAVRPGSEEYLDSEKYQVKVRNWHAPGNLNELVARINGIRHAEPSLQQNDVQFHGVDNPALLWFSKQAPGARRIFVAATTDPRWLQHGFVDVPLDLLGLSPEEPFVMEDLLDGTHYTWRGRRNYVRLDPAQRVAHVFALRDRLS